MGVGVVHGEVSLESVRLLLVSPLRELKRGRTGGADVTQGLRVETGYS